MNKYDPSSKPRPSTFSIGFPSPFPAGIVRILSLVGVFALTIALAISAIALTRGEGRIAAVWPINAIIFVILIRQDARRRAELLGAFAIALLTANLLVNDSPLRAVLFALANAAEVAAAVYIFAKIRTMRLMTAAGILRLFAAAIVSSAGSALMVEAGLWALQTPGRAQDVALWFMADALGYILIVPILWSLMSRPHRSEPRFDTAQSLIQTGIVALVSVAVFCQNSLPLLFLVSPTLVWLGFAGGVRRAALGTLVLTAISVPATLQGYGPVSLIQGGLVTKVLVLQVFLATTSMLGLAVGAAMTDRRRLMVHLRRSRTRLAAISSQQREMLGKARMAERMSGVGHWTLNVSTSEVYWSPEVYAIHGIAPDDFIPKYEDALRFYAEEDRECVGAAVASGLRDGTGWDFEATLVRADTGERRKVRAIGAGVTGADGEVVRAFGVFKDITDERRLVDELAAREHHYRLLADYSTDIIVQLGLDGMITYASPACRLLGVTPEEAVGRSTIDFVIDEDKAHAVAITQRLFNSAVPDPEDRREFRVRNADGEIIWLEGNPRIIMDEDGKPASVITTFRDVTERREREEALAKARLDAETAARAKADFLSNMSHEIRTPLNGVLGFTQLIQQTGLTVEQSHFVQRITSAGRTLRQIVDDILDFSKIEAGKMELDSAPFDLGGVIRDVIDLVDAGRADRSVRIVCACEPDERMPLVADETRVRQILTNIIGNACKFTQQGTVTIGVVRDAGGFEIRVKDTGIGIPEDRIRTLFESFQQADSSVTRRFGGTGLGLAISRSLARLMGGDIGIESRLGEGTLVRIRIPDAASDGADLPGNLPVQVQESVRAARIMVVDDVAMNLELVKIGLTNAGHDVTTFSSAGSAIDSLEMGASFDIILMDVQMPELDGPSAAKIIRSMPGKTGNVPIVALTAHALPSDVAAFKAAGMNAHFPKPVDLEGLDKLVRRLLIAQRAPAPASAPVQPAADPIAQLRLEYRDYLATVSDEIEKILRLSNDDGVLTSVRALAHAIAGTAGSLGFMEVSDVAFELEAAAKTLHRANAPANGLDPVLGRFVDTVAHACAPHAA